MSLEFPPIGIDASTSWTKDDTDTVTGNDGNTTTTTELSTYKTTVESAPYGNGTYKAWTTDTWQSYEPGTTIATGEWPACGAFDKSEGDSNTGLSYHTGRTYPSGSDNSNPGYLAIEMPVKIQLESYSIKNRNGSSWSSQSPKKWIIAGRNGDGDDWVDIHTVSDAAFSSQGETKSWTVSTNKYYSDFRFAWYRSRGDDYISLYTIKLNGKPYQVSASGGISFSEFGNLPFPRFQSIFGNSKKNIKFSQLQEALNDFTEIETGTKSLGLLKSPTMHCGKAYVPSNTNTTIYFPTAFASTPGVFITHQWKDWNLSTASEMRTSVRVTYVTKELFQLSNTESNFTPFVHWMAVKSGSGSIYGLPYHCQIHSTGSNWSSHITHNFSGVGSYTKNDGKTYRLAIHEMDVNNRLQGTLKNSATVHNDGYIELTTATNGIIGHIEYSVYTGNRVWAEYEHYIGGGTGADALYFYWGCTSTPPGEWSNVGGYILAFDEYSNNEIQLQWNGTSLSNVAITPNIDDATWHKIKIRYADNRIRVWMDGIKYLDYTDSARTISTSSVCGWGARTGGANNRHLVKKPKVWIAGDTGTGGLKKVIPVCCQQSASGNTTFWGRHVTIADGYVNWQIGKVSYKPVSTAYTTSTAETFAFLALTAGESKRRIYTYAGGLHATHDAQITYTNTKAIQNPIIIASGTTSGGDSAQVHCWRLGAKRAKYIVKETGTMDGPHAAVPIYAIHLRGTSDFSAKPMWHLDANFINANQKVSSNGQINRWRNSSGKSFKYAVGRGTTKPTLGSDSDGYYVYFNKSQNQYFQIKKPIKWKFTDADGNGTGGITAFCVFKYINISSQNWSRFFDFGNGAGNNNVLWSMYGTNSEHCLAMYNPEVRYYTNNTPLTSNWKIYVIRYNNADFTCSTYADGIINTPTEIYENTATDKTTTLNYIGESNWSGDQFLDGYMREQIVFNEALTTWQIQSISARLGRKWNIPSWTLLFRQTIGYWWTSSQSLSLNSSDPDNDNYSILDQIDTYKNTDGKYRLLYIDRGDSATAGKFNDWRQTSNFTTTYNSVSGYEAVSIYDSASSWGGLSQSTTTGSTRFDGSPGDGNWWFAVGTIQNNWDGGRIPGISSTSQIEIYIYKEN